MHDESFPSMIVSGGQTGVDRAALDVALQHHIPCGGWCPKGRCAEDGTIPDYYPLSETTSSEYAERTEWNVRDSDGTLVLTWGPPTWGTAYTIELAQCYRRPYYVVDLIDEPSATVINVQSWLRQYDIHKLNVAGPRASKTPGIYNLAYQYLESLLINSQ